MNEEIKQKEGKWNAEQHAVGMDWHERRDSEATHLSRTPSCSAIVDEYESRRAEEKKKCRGRQNKQEVTTGGRDWYTRQVRTLRWCRQGRSDQRPNDLPLARRQILAAQSLGFRPQTILSFLHLTVLIVHWSLALFNN